jgi:glycosyltransferase involved in cell wall biosynthesis
VPASVNAVSGLGYIFSGTGRKVRLLRAGITLAYRLILRHPNSRTIFQNPDDRDLFVNNGLIDPARAQVIKGSGVDMTVFSPQPETDDTPVILYAGRLLWQKGIGEFIEAARRLKGQARFVIAGISEAENPSAVPPSQLQEWHDSGLIEWLGQRSDMPTVFAQSHIVCLPSAYGEGVPKVLIEAAACGRAIVTTNSPGCREIALHNHNGLLVPVNDVDALCAALRDLINDPARRQQMGAAGRELAASEFSLEHVNQSTLAIYQTLLATRASHNHD